MIQTGDPTGAGKGGQSIWAKPFEDEIRSTIKVRNEGRRQFPPLLGGTATLRFRLLSAFTMDLTNPLSLSLPSLTLVVWWQWQIRAPIRTSPSSS